MDSTLFSFSSFGKSKAGGSGTDPSAGVIPRSDGQVGGNLSKNEAYGENWIGEVLKKFAQENSDGLTEFLQQVSFHSKLKMEDLLENDWKTELKGAIGKLIETSASNQNGLVSPSEPQTNPLPPPEAPHDVYSAASKALDREGLDADSVKAGAAASLAATIASEAQEKTFRNKLAELNAARPGMLSNVNGAIPPMPQGNMRALLAWMLQYYPQLNANQLDLISKLFSKDREKMKAEWIMLLMDANFIKLKPNLKGAMNRWIQKLAPGSNNDSITQEILQSSHKISLFAALVGLSLLPKPSLQDMQTIHQTCYEMLEANETNTAWRNKDEYSTLSVSSLKPLRLPDYRLPDDMLLPLLRGGMF